MELEFVCRGEKYTIRRNPEYQRPHKYRKDKMTSQAADATLWMPDGKVIPKARVKEMVKEIMGVDKSQFCAIAMIAQGQSGPVNEQAFKDCAAIIRDRHRKRSISSDEDLLALRNRKKESGGYHG